MLVKKTVEAFTEEVASSSPAPGGGSVAALAASLAASLVTMVSNLTAGREKFQDYEEEMKEVATRGEELREKLLGLVDEDTAAFNEVMAAFKMPKGIEEEKRSKAIQKAFTTATELPLEVIKSCRQIMEIGAKVIEHGNPNAISDAGVGILMAGAGARGAAFNVQINLGSLRDEDKKQRISEELASMMTEIEELEEELLQKVKGSM